MGQAKDKMMRDDENRGWALGIARRAGVLSYCPIHLTHSQALGDIEDAYKLGNSRYSAGELDGMFESRREMTDCIKEAVESCLDQCYECKEFLDND